MIPIMVGPHYKPFESVQYLLIFKGGHHVVISKGGFRAHNHKKGGSYGHDHKRWSHIVNPMNVGPHSESYECCPMFKFLKVGLMFTINKNDGSTL